MFVTSYPFGAEIAPSLEVEKRRTALHCAALSGVEVSGVEVSGAMYSAICG